MFVIILPDPSHLYNYLQLTSGLNTHLLLGHFQQQRCFGRTKIQQHYWFRRRIFCCFLDTKCYLKYITDILRKKIKKSGRYYNLGFPDSDQFYALVQGKKHGMRGTERGFLIPDNLTREAEVNTSCQSHKDWLSWKARQAIFRIILFLFPSSAYL